MSEIAVIVPVLGRPHRAQPLADSLRASDPGGLCELYFVCSPNDREEFDACLAATPVSFVAEWESGPGDYARKINYGVRGTTQPWIFTGADDLAFHPGWAEEALRVGEEQQVGMVGTDDLGNGLVRQGRHSTHSLFRRSYVEECGTVDEPGLIYHEGYGHQQCDVEAYETAVARGCFAFAQASVVEHLHAFWGKSEMDATYRKGLASGRADQKLFLQRRRLWRGIAA